MSRVVTANPAGGSLLEMRVAQPKPEHKDFVDKAGAKFAANMVGAIERLRVIVKDRPDPVAVIDEPALPAKGARFLTEPVRSGTAV